MENETAVVDSANESVADATATLDSPSDEQSEPTETVETDATADVEAGEDGTGSENRVNKRIRELTDKLKARTEEAETLRSKLTRPEEQEPEDPRFPWEPAREITLDEYERDVERKAREVTRREINLERDISEATTKYAELNPESESYNRDVDNFIERTYRERIKLNPNLRLKDVVSEVMAIHKGGETRGKEAATARVAEQAAQQAVTSGIESNEADIPLDPRKLARDPRLQKALREKIGVAD